MVQRLLLSLVNVKQTRAFKETIYSRFVFKAVDAVVAKFENAVFSLITV